jgi:hypothetical protein
MTATKVIQRYVLGFVFSDDHQWVLLTQKTHAPDSEIGRTMIGKLNGIGGKCEPAEPAFVAMRRETIEETFGVLNPEWTLFCSMHCAGEWSCDCFVGFVPPDKLRSVPSVNDAGESLLVLPLVSLMCGFRECMANVRWLIPMALEGGLRGDVEYRQGTRGDR